MKWISRIWKEGGNPVLRRASSLANILWAIPVRLRCMANSVWCKIWTVPRLWANSPYGKRSVCGALLSMCFKSTHPPYQIDVEYDNNFMSARVIIYHHQRDPPYAQVNSLSTKNTYSTHNASAKWRQYNQIRHFMRQAGVVQGWGDRWTPHENFLDLIAP